MAYAVLDYVFESLHGKPEIQIFATEEDALAAWIERRNIYKPHAQPKVVFAELHLKNPNSDLLGRVEETIR